MALLAISALVSEEGFSSLSEDQLAAIEAALPDADALQAQQTAADNLAQLEQQLEQTSEALTSSQAVITEREQRISQLESELASLRQAPAEAAAVAISKSDANDSNAVSTAVKDGMSLSDQIAAVKEQYGM